MSQTATEFAEVLALLARHGVEFIVVGGVAAVAHGAPILTLDLDVVHRRTKENIPRLLAAIADLRGIYIRDPRRLTPDASHLVSPGHQLLETRLGRLDLLGSLGPGLDYEALIQDAATVELHGIPTNVLSLERLIAIKQALDRPKDKLMLLQLLAVRDERERLSRAHAASVALVLTADVSAEQLETMARDMPVWILSGGGNDAAVRSVASRLGSPGRVTLLLRSEEESPEAQLTRALATVYDHHGPRAVDRRDTVYVHGAASSLLSDEVRGELGLHSIEETKSGFVTSMSAPS